MIKNISNLLLGLSLVLSAETAIAQTQPNKGGYDQNPFRQMYQEMATPNMYRSASGAPGPMYYQQKADYKMQVSLNEKTNVLTGTQTVTYTNNSPDKLEYLWIQLDQNQHSKNSPSNLLQSGSVDAVNTLPRFTDKYLKEKFDGGFNITNVKSKGKNLKYTINQTMMRIDLDQPLQPGKSFTYSLDWWYNINNYQVDGFRSGFEQLEDGNKIYVIAQFFPRMAVYSDVEGWQNMQFWGSGEFALPFGDYEVDITVPADYMMEATGELQNRKDVFTKTELERYKKAENTFDNPVIVVTQKEAEAKRKTAATATKTWKFKAKNVRDFGISASRTFIYDAMAVETGSTKTMAISLYPPEANPLWEQYSTRAVAHTLKEYSKYTFDYPYPKAVSISAEDQGMEYPMICWNYGRPDKDGYTPDYIKYGMISVIIHEVGHNFFPMIVNSDERQWTWMDEGLNTFLEYLTEQTFEKNYPSRRGPAKYIVPYMQGSQDFLEPIMVNSESIHQFGNNAYAKPAAGLNILREVIMGPELFDHAFKTYAQRWKFKHPTPEDFFRTMEDASAVDLDWFWRGWFYSTQYVDIAIKTVNKYKIVDEVNERYNARIQYLKQQDPLNKDLIFLALDNGEDAIPAKLEEIKPLQDYINSLDDYSKPRVTKNPKYFTEVEFELVGDLIMPVLIDLEYADGTTEFVKLPEQIWRKNNRKFTKVFATDKKITKITVDKDLKTADVDTTNNTWPKTNTPSTFDKFR